MHVCVRACMRAWPWGSCGGCLERLVLRAAWGGGRGVRALPCGQQGGGIGVELWVGIRHGAMMAPEPDAGAADAQNSPSALSCGRLGVGAGVYGVAGLNWFIHGTREPGAADMRSSASASPCGRQGVEAGMGQQRGEGRGVASGAQRGCLEVQCAPLCQPWVHGLMHHPLSTLS